MHRYSEAVKADVKKADEPTAQMVINHKENPAVKARFGTRFIHHSMGHVRDIHIIVNKHIDYADEQAAMHYREAQ